MITGILSVLQLCISIFFLCLYIKTKRERDKFEYWWDENSRWLFEAESELRCYKEKYGPLKVEKKKGRPLKYKKEKFEKIIDLFEKNEKMSLRQAFSKVGIPFYAPNERLKTYGVYDRYIEIKEKRKNNKLGVDKK